MDFWNAKGYRRDLEGNAVRTGIPRPSALLHQGGVAQMVERSLSMREVPGSIPGASTILFAD
ncbi:hypothetical protein PUN28_013650 [Cardiocondyla obscurior]|uniref:Uncharacterized protein n=1 Tax=Cardiocondyla obscurior TaxID=286306 RepID=A0AAW2F3Q8_9HYME